MLFSLVAALICIPTNSDEVPFLIWIFFYSQRSPLYTNQRQNEFPHPFQPKFQDVFISWWVYVASKSNLLRVYHH